MAAGAVFAGFTIERTLGVGMDAEALAQCIGPRVHFFHRGRLRARAQWDLSPAGGGNDELGRKSTPD